MSAEKLNYSSLLDAIGMVHLQAQAGAAGAVNRQLIMRNWIIGAYLVECCPGLNNSRLWLKATVRKGKDNMLYLIPINKSGR